MMTTDQMTMTRNGDMILLMPSSSSLLLGPETGTPYLKSAVCIGGSTQKRRYEDNFAIISLPLGLQYL
jgi:hypothetical protein